MRVGEAFRIGKIHPNKLLMERTPLSVALASSHFRSSLWLPGPALKPRWGTMARIPPAGQWIYSFGGTWGVVEFCFLGQWDRKPPSTSINLAGVQGKTSSKLHDCHAPAWEQSTSLLGRIRSGRSTPQPATRGWACAWPVIWHPVDPPTFYSAHKARTKMIVA